MSKNITPDLTIVGGQPRSSERKQEMEVPVGLEQVLFLAARDEAFKTDLLADRKGALARKGIRLRPTEASTLAAISNDALKTMIAGILPDNPKRRTLMRTVAATAASLAASTALISGCNLMSESGGAQPDIDIDGGDDAGADEGDTD